MARRQNLIIGLIVILSILFFIFAMSMFLSNFGTRSNYDLSTTGSKIALVEILGIIYSPEETVRQLDKYANDSSVKAIVLRLESPGGGVSPAQEIYEKVKRIRDSGKVIIASMGTVAASGAYLIACGADTIMANSGTTTGSIGVIVELPNTKGLMDKIGIKYDIIKSGKFKDTGSPFKSLSDEERKYLQEWVDDAYHQFVDVVSNERNINRSKLLGYADGRVFTGKQALKYGLIDTIGTYEDAINLAAKLGGISGKPKTIKEHKRKLTIFDLLFEDVTQLFNTIQRWPRIKYQVML